MLDLMLSRDPADKRHFVLPGVGDARATGMLKPVITLTDGRTNWTFGGKLGLRSTVEVQDASGATVAVARFNERRIEYGPRSFRIEGGVVVRKQGRIDVELFENDRLVARFEPTQWGLIGGDGVQLMSVDERLAAEDGLLVMFASNCAGHWRALDGISAGIGVVN